MQQPKRFQAATLADAYEMVREELGPEAVILSTRKALSPAIYGQPARQFVEVVAHVPAPMVSDDDSFRPTLSQDMAAHDLVRELAEAAATGVLPAAADLNADLAPPFENTQAGTLSPAAAPKRRAPRKRATPAAKAPEAGPFDALNSAIDRAADVTAPDVRVADAAPAAPVDMPAPPVATPTIADRAMIGMLARQLTEVRTLLDQLVVDRVSERVDAGPAPLRDVHDYLVRQGLAPTLLAPLISQVGESLARGFDRETALRAVERKLATKLPPVPRVDFARRPVAIFLVGPSGAGKTTMAVRMALEIERAHSLRVAIAGTDVNRAGAPQQLAAFGDAAGIDTRLCYAPAELQSLLQSTSLDVVIVDTPGHNGTRRDRMAELNAFTSVARRRSVLLVLPATMKAADLSEVVAAYSGIGIEGLAFTRCDETSTFGALISVSIDSTLGVAYTTHSDQVSEAPRMGDNLALANAVTTGRWPASAAARAQATAAATLARVS